jgi:hypothetical protein
MRWQSLALRGACSAAEAGRHEHHVRAGQRLINLSVLERRLAPDIRTAPAPSLSELAADLIFTDAGLALAPARRCWPP